MKIAVRRGTWTCLLGAAAALLLFAHRAVAATPSCDARALARHEALRAEQLDNWEPVNDRTLLVWASGSLRAELVKLDRPLEGLADAPILLLIDSDHDRVISACGDDAVAIGDAQSQQARIVSMELLSQKRTAQLDRGASATLAVLHRA